MPKIYSIVGFYKERETSQFIQHSESWRKLSKLKLQKSCENVVFKDQSPMGFFYTIKRPISG